MKKLLLLLIPVLLLAVFFFLTDKKKKEISPASSAAVDNGITYLNSADGIKYVGSDNCLPCHKSTHNTFSHSEMGRSMELLTEENIIEDYSGLTAVYDSELNFYYEMLKTDSGFYQREFRLNPQGKVYHERKMKADFTIGSGSNLRMYFHDEEGMFYQLPLTWYTNKKKWDLSPGYRNHKNLRFSRFATRKCITCHNAYLTELKSAVDRYAKPYRFGVDCERCHGPGELHIKEMNDEFKPAANQRTIVNPAKLSTERQLSICMQCHAQGKAWAMQDEEGWFDFKPARLLSSNRSIYYPERTNKNAIEVGESPYRLKLSRCFTESGGELTCITCHNPHRSIKTFSVSHYNEKCLNCHKAENLPLKENGEKHFAVDNCISCHMNKTGTENTLHGVPLTDHWIRKDAYKDEIDWSSLLADPQTLPAVQLIADVDADDDKKDIRKGIAYIEFYNEYDNKPVYLDSALFYLNSKKEKDAQTYFYTAEVFLLKNKIEEALSAYKHAAELNKNYYQAFYKIAEIYRMKNENSTAIDYYNKALALKPQEPSYIEGIAYVYTNLGDYTKAVELFEKALKIDGQNAYSLFTLGTIYAVYFNQPENSIKYFKQASVIDPDLENVFLNLGNAYTLTGDFESAELAYKKELYSNPNSVNAKINLARLYKSLGRNKEADKLLGSINSDK